jgi:hypothetical protein
VEPAAGRGAIAHVLPHAGHAVYATDLIDYGCNDRALDFLSPAANLRGAEAIVTNPPYRHAQQFVELALTRAPLVAMLLRINFLESERRRGILEGGQLARVLVFRNRLPMLHRDGWTGPKASSTACYAWFIWARDHAGSAELRRISWVRP